MPQRFIQGLACRPIIQPSQEDLTMKLSSLSYGNPKKIGRENRKANELGFQEIWLPSSHLMGYMEATESLTYPYLITRDTSPPRELWEFVFIAPSDGCPATAPRVASMQALRSRRMSSTSKLPAPCDLKPIRPVLQTGQAGFGQTATSGLRPRLCGSVE
jgi:hypothetical protein